MAHSLTALRRVTTHERFRQLKKKVGV
ncbi:protein of unknown function [Candidatus Methylomirabilis oxygeniifera]|uniref:Uncharacterized protein n=1 Tax=Methylomirabilis oxygeniifera TaxID=671143 RepID=D5MI31_METO1|nr:protein of unknown function [Candidatus Methylomirabilis oxyfera]